MPQPTAERPPQGLDAYWLGVWRHGLKVMREQGTWTWEVRPLFDEYVFALMAAADARDEGRGTDWDRHAKRASALADQLALTPRGRKAVGLGHDDSEDSDPFARFADELAPRRQARAS